MKTLLDAADLAGPMERLAAANAALTLRYPGVPSARQPVHTVYGGAHLFRATTARRLGELALASLDAYGPDPATFAAAVGLTDEPALAERVYQRVVAKLRREPVEDFRIDFEDGFGIRPDAEEDATAVQAAQEVARGIADGILPPFLGIRIKTPSEELKHRAFRTLDLFLGALVEQAGRLPEGFVVTLPKVMRPEHVSALVDVLDLLEPRLGLAPGSIRVEIMVETPQAVIGADGTSPLPAMIDAGRGRITGAHFGTYDYTASVEIIGAWQRMGHPACDFAKHVMQVTLSGTGVWLSDGATNIMPVGPHRGELDEAQQEENQRVVHRALKLHFDDVTHSLHTGYYQGWDLHPAQLASRYGAVYAFFLRELDSSTRRLRNFVEQATKATLVGDVFDDAATGQGLLVYFLRGVNCGAITEEEVEATGLTLDEVRSRSFVRIMRGRRGE